MRLLENSVYHKTTVVILVLNQIKIVNVYVEYLRMTKNCWLVCTTIKEFEQTLISLKIIPFGTHYYNSKWRTESIDICEEFKK